MEGLAAKRRPVLSKPRKGFPRQARNLHPDSRARATSTPSTPLSCRACINKNYGFTRDPTLRRDGARAAPVQHRRSAPRPPREGPALLQGLVLCGRCGMRMTVRYHSRNGHLCLEYLCQRDGIRNSEAVCQRVPGGGVDQAIGALLVDAVNPVALEVTLAVQRELQSRLDEADRLRHAQVERAQYECEQAQRRYMRVDPDNRLVADSLEAQWNETLRALSDAHEEYARRREQDARTLTNEQHSAILALASDFPRLWNDPATPDRERKRMIR